MAELERLIEDLQSDDPDKRFQACNGLFYAQSIPESAIEALRKTTQDSDTIVADAAQHALDIHIPESTTIPQNQLEDGKSSTTMMNLWGGGLDGMGGYRCGNL